MPNPRRSDEDARLQRLANLSIEIRMLKARAQAAFEEHDNSAGGAYVPDVVPEGGPPRATPAARTAATQPAFPAAT